MIQKLAMKITICGSMTFANKMVEAKTVLEESGHQVFIPSDTDKHIKDPILRDDLELNYKHSLETDIMREHMNLISNSDAILVLNYPKNGIDGYVGTCTLIETSIAYYLNKKIFLLHPTPKPSEARWAHEVRIMKPIVLDGDLSKLANGMIV